MHKVIHISIGNKRLHLPKLLGALMVFGALFKFVESVMVISMKSDVLNNLLTRDLNPMQAIQFQGILNINYMPMGWGDALMILSGSIGDSLFWLSLFVIGLILYNTGRINIPVEEEVYNIPETEEEVKRIIERAPVKPKKIPVAKRPVKKSGAKKSTSKKR
ncbi:MAG: hypothetical protein J7K00_00675 [Candidatus Diapherotrites archaeon]|nr:hypothetical protein [Candidatus Diapherotrites archaeon]